MKSLRQLSTQAYRRRTRRSASLQNALSSGGRIGVIVAYLASSSVALADSVAKKFDSTTTVALPDMSATDSPLNVSGMSGQIVGVRVAVHLTHTSDSDLTISLIAPDGTTAILANRRGGSSENFGSTCTPNPPWDSRTIFDDSAATAIGSGTPPFAGKFKPEQALSVFNDKTGDAVNGSWRLRVTDSTGADVGAIDCWTLWLWSCGAGSFCSIDLTGYWTVYFRNVHGEVTGRILVWPQPLGCDCSTSGQPVTVKFFLSSDTVLDPDDTVIGTHTADYVSGSHWPFVTFRDVQTGVNPAGKYVIAVIDPAEEILDPVRSNNTLVAGPIP
jgi:subtilisin-like proprotein convertase family protein